MKRKCIVQIKESIGIKKVPVNSKGYVWSEWIYSYKDSRTKNFFWIIQLQYIYVYVCVWYRWKFIEKNMCSICLHQVNIFHSDLNHTFSWYNNWNSLKSLEPQPFLLTLISLLLASSFMHTFVLPSLFWVFRTLAALLYTSAFSFIRL